MILEHNGITVDFFNRLPDNMDKVALYLSGGADSALLLYFLSQLDVEIYPINGYDTTTPDIDSPTAARNIIDHIRNKNNSNNIKDLLVYPYNPDQNSKYTNMKPVRRYLEQQMDVSYWMFGTSLGMPDDPRPTFASEPDLYELINRWDDVLFPWATVNKSFIAAQYDKFGLKELSNMTNSCIHSGISPCKECWWCRERYWAFGSYDGGIQ